MNKFSLSHSYKEQLTRNDTHGTCDGDSIGSAGLWGAQRAPDHALRLLGRPVDFERGPALASIAALVHTYPKFYDLFPFISSFLNVFSDETSSQPAKPSDPSLEFFRTIHMQGYPGPPRVHLFPTLKVHDGGGYQPLDLSSSDAFQSMPMCLGDTLDTEVFDTDCTLFNELDSRMLQLSFYTDTTRWGLRRS